MPESWKDWLLTAIRCPNSPAAKVIAWTDALAANCRCRRWKWVRRTSRSCPTPAAPRQSQGLHAPARSIMHNAMASSIWGNATPEAVTLLVVPLFHITGMVSVMHANIYTGATLVMMPRWDRDVAGRLISGWKVTSWTNIPTMVIDLLASPNFAYDLSSLAHIGGGGAAMPQPWRSACSSSST